MISCVDICNYFFDNAEIPMKIASRTKTTPMIINKMSAAEANFPITNKTPTTIVITA